ncbi:hypothetical protein Q5752_005227 [Cryptotrichosporon argae]
MSLHRIPQRGLAPPRRLELASRPRAFALARSPTLTLRSYATSPARSPTTVRRNAIVAGVLLTASAALYYYENRWITSGHPLGVDAGREFSISIRHSSGPKEYFFKRKSDAEVERILTEHESGDSPRAHAQAGADAHAHRVVRWDSNWVASNEPCEDRWRVDNIARTGGRDLFLSTILDGHAGSATSELLRTTLHPTLAVALAGLEAGIVPDNARGWARWAGWLNPLKWVGQTAWTPENVAKTLQQAFLQLDANIVVTPIARLDDVTPENREEFVALTRAADAGACAITALVDAAHGALYVASTGDCRAVAGWQAPDGSWRCDVLTADQMGENPGEVERMKREHPGEEDTVIVNGRVQGGLQPTRAFGDAIYKWTREQGLAIAEIFKAEGLRPRVPRPNHNTPPYVTARPEVTYRSLDGGPGGEKLRFVVMATDGLWDRITSEEATLLVASYLKHRTADPISRTNLAAVVPLSTAGPDAHPYPTEPAPDSAERVAHPPWAFEGDANAATHLIRNSLAGAAADKRAELLSVHGKVARWLRDDVTTTVLFFD